jgi:hypothetical protein
MLEDSEWKKNRVRAAGESQRQDVFAAEAIALDFAGAKGQHRMRQQVVVNAHKLPVPKRGCRVRLAVYLSMAAAWLAWLTACLSVLLSVCLG